MSRAMKPMNAGTLTDCEVEVIPMTVNQLTAVAVEKTYRKGKLRIPCCGESIRDSQG